jgi:RNA polymerase sigma factor (sigma-70 family)
VIAAELRRSMRERRAQTLAAGHRRLDADDVDRLVEKIDAARQVRALHAALQALPEGERAVLELVSVDGLTVAEAAAALDIRQVTARVRLHRARQALGVTAVPSPVEKELMS